MKKCYYISFKLKQKLITPLIIGYTKQRGIFIKVLSSSKEFEINKMKMNSKRKYGITKVPISDCISYYTDKTPKMTYHWDGYCHISGQGIISGFYKSMRKNKGVHTFCPSLQELSKKITLPRFTCLFSENSSILKSTNKKNNIIIPKERIIKTSIKGNKNGIALDIFFWPKSVLAKLDIQRKLIPFSHPRFGIVPTTYIPTPSNLPIVICIFSYEMGHSFPEQEIFSMVGGVSYIIDKKSYQLSIINKKITKKQKNLSLTKAKILLYKLDGIFFKLKKLITKIKEN